MKTINLQDYKYKVPLSYQNKTLRSTLHKTWKEAYKASSKRGVQMYSLPKLSLNEYFKNEYFKEKKIKDFWSSIKPFLQKLKNRKK